MWINEVFLNAMISELQRYKGEYFTLCVNNNVIMADGKVARVSVPRAQSKQAEPLQPTVYNSNPNQILVGGLVRDNKKTKLVQNDTIHLAILNRLKSTIFGGIDFDGVFEMDNKFISIEKDIKLRIMYITTKPYLESLRILQSSDKELNLRRLDGKSLNLDSFGLVRFKREVTKYLIQSYMSTCENYLALRLKRVRALSFYYCTREYIPLMIMAPGLYNPFISNSSISGEFTKSTLAKVIASGRSVEHGSLIAYYVTSKQICECLGLSKFIHMPWGFAMRLVAGQLMPSEFPNKNKVINFKLEQGKPVEITEDERRQIEKKNDEMRNSGAYVTDDDLTLTSAIGSLNILSNMYYKEIGAKNERELTSIINNTKLLTI